jgi:hypothetical protein
MSSGIATTIVPAGTTTVSIMGKSRGKAATQAYSNEIVNPEDLQDLVERQRLHVSRLFVDHSNTEKSYKAACIPHGFYDYFFPFRTLAHVDSSHTFLETRHFRNVISLIYRRGGSELYRDIKNQQASHLQPLRAKRLSQCQTTTISLRRMARGNLKM